MSEDRKAKSGDQYTFLEGMIRVGQEDLGRRIVAAAEKTRWSEATSTDAHAMRMWVGDADGFHFVVTDFEIKSQGFTGQRGADGIVRYVSGIIRLGHQLGAYAVALARAQKGIA